MGIPDQTRLRNATVLVGSSVSVLPLAALAPALPTLALAFQDTPNAELLVRLTLTMPALLIAVGAPFAGLLLDRWGRRPVIVLSLIGFGLAGVAGFLLDSLVAILVSRAVVGLAAAGLISGFTTLVADYFTGRQLNRFMGYQGASIAAGAMVGTLMGGFLADLGWQFPFLTHLYAFLVLPVVVLAVREPGRGLGAPSGGAEGVARRERLPKGEAPPEHPAICCVEQVHPAIASAIPKQQEPGIVGVEMEAPDEGPGPPLRTIAWVFAIAFSAVVAFNVFPVQLPFYLTALTAASNAQIALALALQMLVSFVVALRYQRIKARLSHRSIFALVFVTIGAGHLIVAGTPEYLLVILGSMIAGLGMGLLAPNLGAVVALTVPPHVRGRAMGGLTASIFLGQFFSPLVLQPVLQQSGIVATFWVAGIGSLAAAVALLLWRLRPVLGRERAARPTRQERGAS
jgi:MFS family permease